MGDNNNARAGSLPQTPHPALATLERLLGGWTVSGSYVTGHVRFEKMEGGFYVVQHVDLDAGGRHIKGVEYIGYDEDTQTLRSHFMDNHGSNFTYTWEIGNDRIRIWFGEKDSGNFYQGRFDDGGNSYAGSWQWPTPDGGTGGYQATMTRMP